MRDYPRLSELDSIRGLAAASVMLSHLLLVLPYAPFLDMLEHTPLYLFWASHEAVLLFFMLSGFVLSLPYYNANQLSYKNYVIRRICRIYIPYIISILAATLLMRLLAVQGRIPAASQWLNDIWAKPVSLQSIIDHVIFIKSFDVSNINPVIWSLVHEMRISLLFPVIMYVILRSRWKYELAFLIGVPCLFFAAHLAAVKWLGYDLIAYAYALNSTSYEYSVHYSFFFIAGALLAKYRVFLQTYYNKLPLIIKVILLFAGICLYSYKRLLFYDKPLLHVFMLEDWVAATGCAIFIIFSLYSRTAKRFLLCKLVYMAGKISYSLYLSHLVVVLSAVYLFHNVLPVEWIVLISAAVSIATASIMYSLVEKPAMIIGKRLAPSNKHWQLSVQSMESNG